VLLEDAPGLVGRDLVAQERLVLAHDLAHARLDAIEVVGGEGDAPRQLEVVVEAVFHRGADAEGGVGEQVEHRLGQHVGGRVADDVEAVVAVGGDDADRVAVVQLGGQVALLAVDDGHDRRFGQRPPDGRRQVTRRGARGQGAGGTVGQRDLDLWHEGRG
jgi:hypothetical protein